MSRQHDLHRGRPLDHDLDRVSTDIWWEETSRPIRIRFPAASVSRDVRHGLGVVPDGYILVQADALIHAAPGVPWTPEVAYLQTDQADARATVIFYTLRQEVLHVP